MIKHLLTGREFDLVAFEKLIDTTASLKSGRGKAGQPRPLEGKSIGMIFSKSSTRTRVSFEVGIHELGGQPLYLDAGKTQMGRGESIPDTARVLSRFLHGIVIRTFKQSDVEELAQWGSIPIVNALTDDYHPCQAFCDVFTIWERKKTFSGIKMAYLGDGSSNMANSLAMTCSLVGIDFSIAAPEEYKPSDVVLNEKSGPGKVTWTKNPKEALQDADFIYTDVWVSMGFEAETEKRMRILKPYQVDMNAVKMAKPDVRIMHCLPAHRNEEITDEVMDSEYSIVFDEAENRLHMHKAILCTLFS